MSGLDVEAALVGLKDLMDTIPSLMAVGIGAPESLSAQVQGWVTIGDPEDVGPKTAGGPYELPINLIGWFGYAVQGGEEAAERQLAQFLAELTRRLIQNRLREVDGVGLHLGGSVHRMGLPHAAAGASEYASFAGSETRVYPLGVLVTLRETVS
jgi:hypothetical protein